MSDHRISTAASADSTSPTPRAVGSVTENWATGQEPGKVNRRHFLKGALIAASTPAVAVAGSAPFIQIGAVPELTPQESLEAAVAVMEAAMVAVHGEGVRIIRNANHIVSFLEPEKPRIVPFQGDGDYEICLSDRHRPIHNVIRFGAFDHIKEGRCFRLRPTHSSKKKDVYYMFERELERVLIRKIR